MGAFFIVLWFVVGGVGQSLHPEKTDVELCKGTLPSSLDDYDTSKRMTQFEGYLIAKGTVKTCLVYAFIVGFGTMRIRHSFWLATSYGFAAFFAIFLIFSSIIAVDGVSRKRKQT